MLINLENPISASTVKNGETNITNNVTISCNKKIYAVGKIIDGSPSEKSDTFI